MRLKGLYILDKVHCENVYSQKIRKQIELLVDIYAPICSIEDVKENPRLVKDMQVLFSGWGCPVFDRVFLKIAENLQMVFYGAGSVKSVVTPDFWHRPCKITSAASANGIAVAQFNLAQILLCLKRAWTHARRLRKTRKLGHLDVPGVYNKSTVGIISLGIIGRGTVDYLKIFGVNIIAYDPYVKQYDGIEMVLLDQLFKQSDVVVCCTPWTKQTEGMITGKHFAMMKANASFINSARGAVVREQEMVQVLSQRADITALLDVTWPIHPEVDSPLWIMDNVVLTPHIAGSMQSECGRMGEYMLNELKRYLNNEPLLYEVTQDTLERIA